jgi:hypothetical protein
MDKGEVSIDAAAQIATQPAEEQKHILAKQAAGRKQTVNRLRSKKKATSRPTPAPSQPPEPAADDEDGKPNAARFSVNFGSPRAIAKRLFQKLGAGAFRELVAAMCELLENTPCSDSVD